jgi:hypothetical protein
MTDYYYSFGCYSMTLMDHKLLRPLYDLVFLFLFTLGGGEFQQSCIGEIWGLSPGHGICCLA